MNGNLGPQVGDRVKAAHKSMCSYLSSLSRDFNVSATTTAKVQYLGELVRRLSIILGVCLRNPSGEDEVTIYREQFRRLLQHLSCGNPVNIWYQDSAFRKVLIPVPCNHDRPMYTWEITSMGALVDMHLGVASKPSETQIVTVGMIGGLILSLDKGRRDLLKKTLEDAPNFRELALTILEKSE